MQAVYTTLALTGDSRTPFVKYHLRHHWCVCASNDMLLSKDLSFELRTVVTEYEAMLIVEQCSQANIMLQRLMAFASPSPGGLQ